MILQAYDMSIQHVTLKQRVLCMPQHVMDRPYLCDLVCAGISLKTQELYLMVFLAR